MFSGYESWLSFQKDSQKNVFIVGIEKWIYEEPIFSKLDPLAPILGGQSSDCGPIVFPGDFSSSYWFQTFANRSLEKSFGSKCQLLLDTTG